MSSSDLSTRGRTRRAALAADGPCRAGRVGASSPVATVRLASPSSILLGSLGFGIVFLLAWQFLPPALGVPSFIIPTVTDLAREFGRMVQRENLLVHILSTATIATIGFVIGSFLGAAMGYILGMSVFVEKVLSPYILGLQIAPKVAFAPLFIMWLGYNAWPKLLVTILVVFFPILVNVLQSMKTVDRDLINLARAYSMSRLQIFWKIEVPASMPALMAGLRIGATLGGDRRHRRRAGRRQYRARLSHHLRRRPGQYRDGVQRDRAADPDRHRALRRGRR